MLLVCVYRFNLTFVFIACRCLFLPCMCIEKYYFRIHTVYTLLGTLGLWQMDIFCFILFCFYAYSLNLKSVLNLRLNSLQHCLYLKKLLMFVLTSVNYVLKCDTGTKLLNIWRFSLLWLKVACMQHAASKTNFLLDHKVYIFCCLCEILCHFYFFLLLF